MLRLAFDFIITWRETRTRPNAYVWEYSEYLVRVWRYLWEVCWPEIMQLLLRLMILP